MFKKNYRKYAFFAFLNPCNTLKSVTDPLEKNKQLKNFPIKLYGTTGK